ncbi:phosphomannomutase [Aliiroseovarius sp. Z3]|uniref:phosphomannomutase n=1 Tax=Aliiroseovarius sp. Z3 TaxID=2811402 RepID=UPI0023B2D436|nr:phosphomannomutase [Aliiroseovarius sp. Z3]MDE9450240.1 phosphomannomutase [Aliiroseovarius sp. Z3]
MVKFGTSGVRGLVTELTPEVVQCYVRAFLGVVPHSGVLLIGQDLRPSSSDIARSVSNAANALGLKVHDCGQVPTPALALAAETLGAPAVMVTGSHIPADRNGLKFYRADGEITKDDEALIQTAFEQDQTRDVSPKYLDVLPHDATAPFLARYADFFGPEALRGLRIGVYQHSSVARDLLIDLIRALGGKAVPLGWCGTFVPIDTEAVDTETRMLLQDWVRDNALDALVSTDGDADRPMLINSTGKLVPGDILSVLAARYIGAETIVTPVSSNTVVEATGAFRSVRRTRIGSPYVIAGMSEAASNGDSQIAGYEANGGFLLGFEANRNGRTIAPLMTRDFALPILAALAAAKEANMSLSAFVADLPARFVASNRLQDVPKNISDKLVAGLQDGADVLPLLSSRTITKTDPTDGIRLYFADESIVHVRPSGNAPELRCYVEAGTEGAAAELLNDMLRHMETYVSGKRE